MKRNLLFVCIFIVSGLSSCYYETMEKQELKGLIFTGNDHPAHDWKATSPVIESILESDTTIHIEIDITEDKEELAKLNEKDYDFLVLNYANYEDPEGLSEEQKMGFLDFLDDGGGLVVLHFSNGAFHFSLQGAGEGDWPEYRRIVRRVWDNDSTSTHDPYGEFEVKINNKDHYITKEAGNFETHDELYFNQVGDMSLKPLFTAHSKKSNQDEPLAWAYNYGDARVFQTLLGHSVESYQPEQYREILRRGVEWVCRVEK